MKESKILSVDPIEGSDPACVHAEITCALCDQSAWWTLTREQLEELKKLPALHALCVNHNRKSS